MYDRLNVVIDVRLGLKSTMHHPHIFSRQFALHTMSSLPCDELKDP